MIYLTYLTWARKGADSFRHIEMWGLDQKWSERHLEFEWGKRWETRNDWPVHFCFLSLLGMPTKSIFEHGNQQAKLITDEFMLRHGWMWDVTDMNILQDTARFIMYIYMCVCMYIYIHTLKWYCIFTSLHVNICNVVMSHHGRRGWAHRRHIEMGSGPNGAHKPMDRVTVMPHSYPCIAAIIAIRTPSVFDLICILNASMALDILPLVAPMRPNAASHLFNGQIHIYIGVKPHVCWLKSAIPPFKWSHVLTLPHNSH